MALRQGSQRSPILDLVVAIIAVPLLILFALQLEKNMQDKWAESTDTKWIVFGLGIGMLLISILICGYVTHRLGVCLWTGPIEDPADINRTNYSHINCQRDILQIVDSLPPSYESVTKFDIPPPPYDVVVVNIETKEIPSENVSTHI